MPISPMKWNMYGKPVIGDVVKLTYGTKRKIDGAEDDHDVLQNHLSSPNLNSKRVCLWGQQNHPLSVRGLTDLPIDQSDYARHPLVQSDDQVMEQPHQMDHTQVVESLVSPSAETHPPSAETNPPSAETNPPSAEPHPPNADMDINAEDMHDYGEACDAMDGEGAVDQSQYGIRAQRQHEQHCFGEEMSPNSGNTRCYCRPSWDSMLSTRSFFSDIY